MPYEPMLAARTRARNHARTPMRVGLISDIHADATALALALDVLFDAGVDRIVCLGDVVQKGPDGDAVIETLRAQLIPSVAGNHDDAELALGVLSQSSLEWLAGLPDCRDFVWCGKSVTLAHESPLRQGRVLPGEVPKRLKRYLRRHTMDVLILGHTHIPMRTRYRDLWIFNPGSVSRGRGGFPRTCAVLELPSLDFTVLDIQRGRSVALDR